MLPLRRSSSAEVPLQAGSEPKMPVPGEEPRWQEWQVDAMSDRDGEKCHQGFLRGSTHLMLVNILSLGRLSSVTPIIAAASSTPFVLSVQYFIFFSNTVIESSDLPRLPALFEEVPQSRMIWTVQVETGACWFSCKELFALCLPPAYANSRRNDSSFPYNLTPFMYNCVHLCIYGT